MLPLRREVSIEVTGSAAFDENVLVVAAARVGIGLPQIFKDEMRADLAAGIIVPALPHLWTLYFYQTSLRYVPGPLRAFINFAAAHHAERA